MKNSLQSSSRMLFLAICLFFTGCSFQDHVIPELLQIGTETVAYNDGWNFKVRADKLGDTPVTEHGILYLAFFRASNDNDYVPRIEHGSKIKFDGTLVLGANTYKYTGNAFAGRYFFYYRAYAVKADGSVVYGEIRNFTF
ncbi:hypothetical protein LXM25_00845 [Dyadobacter sp. LJ53]|uniref:hypothetical protein n=1 Tax=Dyadobacter chenwenxiniae TaxID=2906456 RepID=UPI001F3B9B58|nr:hypothetical protein [Dyadobacter chenwenxiniae]MCF0048580.1 hypothetical protein [Dyadobacter chenwenxiniae]